MSNSISFTTEQLLSDTSKPEPYTFIKGMQVTFSEVLLPESLQSSIDEILKNLGEKIKEYRACLSPIPPGSIKIEKTNPLTFNVLEQFQLHSANLDNWRDSPFNRFAFRNIDSILSVDPIIRGQKPPIPLLDSNPKPSSETIEQVTYKDWNGQEKPFKHMLETTQTDAIVILRDGEIIHENYFNGQTPDSRHILFSATKSLTGLVVAQLIHEGVIDPEKQIKDYVPELETSAFGDARVIDLLDMTTGLKFNEDYSDPNSEMAIHFISGGFVTPPPGYDGPRSVRAFLPNIQKEGNHNEAFHYVSVNTETLAWVVERAMEQTGKKTTLKELFEERIWSRIGAEQDAFITKDSAGDHSWAGGLNATIRDFARIGQMILNRGKVGDEQLISPEVFDFMRNRNMRDHFIASGQEKIDPYIQGWSYANQFWRIHNEHDSFTAWGIHGQIAYIDPETKMVFAIQSSYKEAEDANIGDIFVACHAVSKHLAT